MEAISWPPNLISPDKVSAEGSAEPYVSFLDKPEDDPTDFEFECPPILIKNAPGLPDIDIVDAYRKKMFSAKTKCPEGQDPGIMLPASVYKPSWEHLEDVRKPIIQAAKAAHLDLFCKTTNQDKKGLCKTPGQGKFFVLACAYNGISKARQRKEEASSNAETKLSDFGVPLARYDSSHRKDPIVNKALGNRRVPGEEKGAAMKKSKRTGTKKRNGETAKHGGDRCPFVLRVNLIEDQCWHIPWKNFDEIMHCGHLPEDRGVQASKKNQIEDGARESIKMAGKHMRNGVGLRNYAKEVTGKCSIAWICIS